MAKVESFPVITPTSITTDHMMYVVNQTLDTDHKLQVKGLLPIIADVGSAGQAIHNNLTNAVQFNLRKLASADSKLTVTTHSDGHLLLTVVEAQINLANCNNSSGFLTTVNLASNVGSTILPVANGGTGASTLTANGALIGNGTGAVTAVDMSTKGHLLVGDGSGNPQALAVGTNGYILKADSGAATGLSYLQTLPVANGGTGATSLTANGVLIGNGTGAVTTVDLSTKGTILVGDGSGNPQGLAVGTNGYWLVADTSAATGLSYAERSLANLTEFRMPSSQFLDMNQNNIDMGTGWINGDGSSNEGLNFDTTGKAFFGQSSATAYFTSTLNLDSGGINMNGNSTIGMTSAATGTTLTINSGAGSSGNGGILTLEAGSSSGGNGDGGDLILTAGDKNGSGDEGDVLVKTYISGSAATALTINGTNRHVTVEQANLVIANAASCLAFTGSTNVTQSTDHSTAVTNNSAVGIITLAGVSLASGAEATFTVNNSVCKTDSIIMVTVESPAIGSTTDDSVLIAQTSTIGAGSFRIALKNVGDAATDTNARKVHYMIMNKTL